jgi:YegS/Rv2252/BmrU family lipid kinase
MPTALRRVLRPHRLGSAPGGGAVVGVEGEVAVAERWIAVVNAKAGSSDDPRLDEALDVLRSRALLEVRRTEGPEDLREAVDAARGGVVVAVGGDGSIHAVVAAIDALHAFDDVELAVVPLGTGNDFVRTLGISDDPVEAAQQALACEPRAADLIRDAEDRLVVNAAHVGLGAEANIKAAPWKKALGPVGYAVGAVITGVVGKGIRASVTVDGQPVHSPRRLIQVAVGNGRYVGGGAPLLPEADPFDGSLDVAVVWAHARWKRLGYAWRLRRGRHPMRDDVVYLKVREVTVVGESTPANLDGEIVPAQSRHAWRVEPGRLRLRAPAGAPPDLED